MCEKCVWHIYLYAVCMCLCVSVYHTWKAVVYAINTAYYTIVERSRLRVCVRRYINYDI